MTNLYLKCVILGTFLVGLSLVAFGQDGVRVGGRDNREPSVKALTNPCNLFASSLPRFVGLQLRMSYDDVLSVYPEIEKDQHFHKTFDKDGSGVFMIQAKDLSNAEAKEDALQITLAFEEYTSLGPAIVYGPEKWQSIQEAVSEYSKLIGVEESLWEFLNDRSAQLNCLDFAVYVNSIEAPTGRQNSISILPTISKTK